MTSINKYPTFHYSQPEEYHFSHDSVFLAREVFERLQELLSQDDVQILDLCAGCGIVGLDLAFHLLKEKSFKGQIEFLEVQDVYTEYFKKNRLTLQSLFSVKDAQLNWQIKNYAEAHVNSKYDLIISNPPYFETGKGLLSPSEFKNRCRFFVDSDWQTMVQFIQRSLKPTGKAYFLVREDLKNEIAKQYAEISFPFQVRGTWVAYMTGAK